jgi:HK97 family phage prohead protease
MEQKTNIEIRRAQDIIKIREEVREKGDAKEKIKHVTGYAVVFDKLSAPMYCWYSPLYESFREVILPEAVNRDLIDKSDILMLVNHNRSAGLLARSKFGEGSLNISIDKTGVFFDFEVPNTQFGNDTYELIQRGDITQASFAFTVAYDGGEEIKEENKELVRYIKKIDALYDLSIVDSPAYDETSVSVNSRCLDDFCKANSSDAIESLKKNIRVQYFKESLRRKYNI